MELATLLQFFPPALRELIVANDVSDVMINPDGSVYADRSGQLIRHPEAAVKTAQLLIAVQNIGRMLGADIDESNPILDSRLPDGSRVAAVLSQGEMTVTIRRFNRWFSTRELVELQTIPGELESVLLDIMHGSHNVLVSGGTSSGKSTLAKALLDHAPASDRLIVIEKPRELRISQPNVARWEARDAVLGRPAITVAQLLVAALRHRPDRIVIGEVREPGSAYELLQAMNTGHSGTLSTIHADSALDALHRLGDLALAAHSNQSAGFVREQVSRTIDFAVHVERSASGRRRIAEVARVRRGEFNVEPLYVAAEEEEEACRL